MRMMDVAIIEDEIRRAVQTINLHTPEPVMIQLDAILMSEPSPAGRSAMVDIVANRHVASARAMPMCQDTGMAIVFLEIGQDVHFIGGDLRAAITNGVRRGYDEGYLRKSVVSEPLFERANTKDNTPAVIHTEIVSGERVSLIVAAKGFGAENMSRALVLTPADGIAGVKREVVHCVEDAGPNACPPIVVGVGVGGTLEMATYLAKKALMRDVGVRHPDARYAALELELLDLVNRTGVGPQGWGGVNTALDVRIEYYPTHIAGLPLAINLDCHLQRHMRIEL
ncbi:MAG: fumarate hydratase [Chloroflexota bacterium]|nr:fumarate hydratase [Chloroflexota bacterium]